MNDYTSRSMRCERAFSGAYPEHIRPARAVASATSIDAELITLLRNMPDED
jgi:hypothetical protein